MRSEHIHFRSENTPKMIETMATLILTFFPTGYFCAPRADVLVLGTTVSPAFTRAENKREKFQFFKVVFFILYFEIQCFFM